MCDAAAAERSAYRLVAFDVDGTLVEGEQGKVVWQLLNQRFGGDDKVNVARYHAYQRGEITYAQWVDLDVEEWVAARATREQIADEIRRNLRLVSGARETVDALRARGYRLAVISGTLDLTLELLFPGHPFEEVFTNRIWFGADGQIAGWQATPYDMEGKAHALRAIAGRMGIPLPATVYVGDNVNDLQVMQLAGLAVAFEPKDPSVARQARAVLRRDLRGLLALLANGGAELGEREEAG
jgi:phosphoserine phosphatase